MKYDKILSVEISKPINIVPFVITDDVLVSPLIPQIETYLTAFKFVG